MLQQYAAIRQPDRLLAVEPPTLRALAGHLIPTTLVTVDSLTREWRNRTIACTVWRLLRDLGRTPTLRIQRFDNFRTINRTMP
jgi:hypothetical protein